MQRQSLNARECVVEDLMETSNSNLLLLADDDICLLGIHREILENMGYRVVTAANGKEAIVQYKKYRHEIMLAIFDVQMPWMSGPEAAKYIASLDASLPFIFVTGYDSHSELKKLSLPQGFQVLSKPIDFNVLATTVQKTINKQSAIKG